MTNVRDHISVCICTFKRPVLLNKLFDKISLQKNDDLFDYSITVADNDHEMSAKPLITDFALRSKIPVVYCIEPDKNIAKARNKVIENSIGNHIAFIDDDEYPDNDWLLNLYRTGKTYNVDGVLGPVLPYFEHKAPGWAIKGGFFERPRYITGYRLNWTQARTGNVLFKREIIHGLDFPFQVKFATGSEDVDFFKRMMMDGKAFIWCDEAPVYELVTPERTTRIYQIKLSLLRGGDSAKHRDQLLKDVIKALIAIPAYVLALPFLFIAGDHHFMKYMKKLFDHIGRLLALFHINPVKKRAL